MLREEMIKAGVEMMLKGMGVPDDHNFKNTPARVARMYAELFSPAEIDIPVFDEDYTDEVILKGHTFYTLCPHHLLPVRLKASLAYLPAGKVIGASKLMRMMHDVNRYPMTQEYLTAKILQRVQLLTEHTARGAAVYIIGQHGCFSVRGVRDHDAEMITFKSFGEFDRPEARRQFLEMVR